MPKLTRDFYAQDTLTVAPALLGTYLVRMWNGVPLVGRITETEAYIGRIDKACHAYGGKRTRRTETLYAAPGTAYLYLIYGMYDCLNLVTEPENEPCAVLIRALEPRCGTDLISQNRYGCPQAEQNAYQRKHFLNGPGKLCKGLALTRAQNGADLTGDTLYVADSLSDLGLPPWPGDGAPRTIQTGPRIGVEYAGEAAQFPWRFYL